MTPTLSPDDLIATIAAYASLITARQMATADGWRITVCYGDKSLTFEFDYPEDFTRQPLTTMAIVSALWAMTGCSGGGQLCL